MAAMTYALARAHDRTIGRAGISQLYFAVNQNDMGLEVVCHTFSDAIGVSGSNRTRYSLWQSTLMIGSFTPRQ
jgi:hypothetical protein